MKRHHQLVMIFALLVSVLFFVAPAHAISSTNVLNGSANQPDNATSDLTGSRPQVYFFVHGVQYRFLSPTGDCGGQNHCTSSTTPLQDALDTVAAGLHPDGGKIYLGGGIFHENIRLTKLGSDLVLVGVDKEQPTVINGAFQIVDTQNAMTLQALTLNSNGADVQLTANRVTLANSRIEATGEYGGHVQVLGHEVILTGTTINASGTRGGGQVNIGGSYQGQTAVPQANITIIDSNTIIHADALQQGNGGTVIVWGSEEVHFSGTISTEGGDRGFVEISTHGSGNINGRALTGNLLVDPEDVCVNSPASPTCSGVVNPVFVAASTIASTLSTGSDFTINTTNAAGTGTGKVVFTNTNINVNNNTGTSGTFRIEAADEINTGNTVFSSSGSTGTNYEFYAGSSLGTAGTPVATADVIQGGQSIGTGGGHVIFDAADDVFIGDPLLTNGGDVTLIARGGDGTGVVTIGASGNTNDDHIDTTDSAGGAGTVTIRTDGDLALNAIADPTIIANGGVVAFERLTTGNISAGDDNGGLHISQTEWDKISTETIYIGAGNTTNAYLDNLSATPVETIQSGTLLHVVGTVSTTGNNNLTLQSDRMQIAGTVNAGTGIVTLLPMTTGNLIDLGSTTDVAANTLELSDAEIDQITAGTLRIGSSDAGSIDFTDAISPAATGTLSLITGDEILNTNLGTDVQVANLALQAVNGIGNDSQIDMDVDTVAALNTTAGGIAIIESFNGGDLIVGAVDGVVGLRNTATTGFSPILAIQLETNNGNLTVNNDIYTSRRNIFIVAQQGNGGSGDRLFTNNANIVDADSGNNANNARIDVRANNMTLSVGSTISATNRVILEDDPSSTATVAIILGGADGANTLGLTDAELDTVSTSGTLQIGHSGSGNIDVTAAIDLTDGPDIPTAELNSGAAIGGSSGNVFTANILSVTAGTGAGSGIGTSGDPFAVSASELTTSGSGDQYLSEADSVTIGDADLDAGTGNTVELAGGTFLTTSSGGDIQNNTTVQSGATLAGTGTVNGIVTAQSSGVVAPGSSPGLLNTGDVTFMAGSNFNVEVNGLTTAGTDYDQLNVSGSVTIDPAANLVTSGTITGTTPGATITIINNDGVDAVNGNFVGLAEGAALTVNGQAFTISYVGGDGNDVVLIENTAPTLTSFTRQDPATSPTNADSLVFRATFSEAVQNVDTGDFAVDSTATTMVTGVSPVSTSVYDVTVSGGNLADFDGEVGLDLSGSQDIQDLVGNALPAGEPATDETYTLDNTAVTVVSSLRASASPTIADSVDFIVSFSEDATGVDIGDFDLVTSGVSGAAVTGISGSGSVYTVSVSTGSGIGDIQLIVPATATITDSVGNAIGSLPFNDGETYEIRASIYLPLVLNNFVSAPDLVVDNLSATGSQVTVTISNQGSAPVVDAFWVDVYLNPTTAPTGVNQGWQDLGSQGLVWGVDETALPLNPGESLTLTVGDSYYHPELSNFNTPLPTGSSLYAQVDSFNTMTTYGGVLESHEITGGIYNNISGPVVSQAKGVGLTLPAAALPSLTASSSLPRRD